MHRRTIVPINENLTVMKTEHSFLTGHTDCLHIFVGVVLQGVLLDSSAMPSYNTEELRSLVTYMKSLKLVVWT
jgi:hypothetical protein